MKLAGWYNCRYVPPDRVGHYLATWALLCPLARRQFKKAVQYVNTPPPQTTGEASKAAIEAYANKVTVGRPSFPFASFPRESVCRFCEHLCFPGLNFFMLSNRISFGSPQDAHFHCMIALVRISWLSWRSLSELYTLRKLEYHRTIPGGPYARPTCTEWDFQARWKELVGLVELDEPVATVLPKATGISWPFASLVKYILFRPGLVRSIDRSYLLTFIVRGDAYPVAGGNWTQLIISLANFNRLARSAAGF